MQINNKDKKQISNIKTDCKSGIYIYRTSDKNMKTVTGKIIFI